MRVRANIDTSPGRKLGRTHVIEEHPRTNLSQAGPWQQPPDLEVPEIDHLGFNDLRRRHQQPPFCLVRSTHAATAPCDAGCGRPRRVDRFPVADIGAYLFLRPVPGQQPEGNPASAIATSVAS
jgi:hypothetical protein